VRITDVKTIALRAGPLSPKAEGIPPPIAPVSVFPRDDRIRTRGQPRIGTLIVVVTTDEGVTGLGVVGVGREAHLAVIENDLKQVVIGEDPFEVEKLWTKMYRISIPYGRKGIVVECISGIDIALWDIMGKVTGQPVYNLLGGKTRERIQLYASSLFANRDLETLAAEAKAFVAQGYTFLKMRFGFTAVDGPAGMKKNLQRVKTIMDAVGDEIPLAGEAAQGWDVPYAIAMIRQMEAEGINMAWVEEPVISDDIDGLAQIRAAVRTPISSGEHEFTRYGFRDLIAKKAVDILQPDIGRVGGITEARKIWSMAAAYELPVIPHTGKSFSYHLVISHMNSPMAENYVLSPDSEDWQPTAFLGDPVPADGFVTMSGKPGLGLELNQEVIERLRLP
jgi:L-rhamnonate dehydratase